MTLEIRIYDGDLFSQPLYPDYIKEKCKNNTLTLEDVFNMGSEVEAQILLFGYDEFSGARKYFISKKYNIRDVVEGNYKDRSMKIKVSGG